MTENIPLEGFFNNNDEITKEDDKDTSPEDTNMNKEVTTDEIDEDIPLEG